MIVGEAAVQTDNVFVDCNALVVCDDVKSTEGVSDRQEMLFLIWPMGDSTLLNITSVISAQTRTRTPEMSLS